MQEKVKKYNQVKLILVMKNKSAKWLAEQLGRNRSTISSWSTNKNQPDLPTLFEIAKLLEVSPCELLGDGEEEK